MRDLKETVLLQLGRGRKERRENRGEKEENAKRIVMYEKPRIRERRVCIGINVQNHDENKALKETSTGKMFLLHTMVSQCISELVCSSHKCISKLFPQTLMIQSKDKQLKFLSNWWARSWSHGDILFPCKSFTV